MIGKNCDEKSLSGKTSLVPQIIKKVRKTPKIHYLNHVSSCFQPAKIIILMTILQELWVGNFE